MGIVKLENPASRTMPSSAEVVSACCLGMRTGTPDSRDCCESFAEAEGCWLEFALEFANDAGEGVCGSARATAGNVVAVAGNASGVHANRQDSTPSQRRIRCGDRQVMCEPKKPENLPSERASHRRRTPGNGYYITIFRAGEQQFSPGDRGEWSIACKETPTALRKALRRSAHCDNNLRSVSPMKSHSSRQLPGSGVIHDRRRWFWIFGAALVLGACVSALLGGCGGGSSTQILDPPPAIQPPAPLQAGDVQNVIQAAVNSVNVDMVVAVVDRAGIVLAVYRTQNAPTMAVGNYGQMSNANDVAVALARTGAFFSNDQAPLSSRTIRYLSVIHLPPGVDNQPNADLYGIENTNRGCTLVNTAAYQALLPPATALGGGPGLGVLTGKADLYDSNPNAVNPGGVPIFDQPAGQTSVVLGGIGVVTASSNLNVAEYAALVGST